MSETSTILALRQIGVITNPNSRKNKRRPGRAEALQRQVGPAGRVIATESLEALGAAVRELREQGAQYWVADGGDGSLFWMLNTVARELGDELEDVSRIIPFAVPANGGTIDFVARRVGIRGRVERILRVLRSHTERGEVAPAVDLPSLRIELVQRKGEERIVSEQLCFSTALAGFGCRFFDHLYALEERSTLKIGAQFFRDVAAAFLRRVGMRWAVPRRWLQELEELFTPIPLRMVLDGRELPWTAITTLNASAFSVNFGGLFRLFPAAGEGKMHVIAGEPSDLDVALNAPRMMTGRPLRCERLYDGAGETLEVEAIGDELMKPVLDGEVFEDVERLVVRLGPQVRFARV